MASASNEFLDLIVKSSGAHLWRVEDSLSIITLSQATVSKGRRGSHRPPQFTLAPDNSTCLHSLSFTSPAPQSEVDKDKECCDGEKNYKVCMQKL